MNAITNNSTDRSSLMARMLAAVALMIVNAWDRFTDTPSEFSFVVDPDRTKVDLVMMVYDPQTFFLTPVGVKMNRGGDTIKRHNRRALDRLVANARQVGFYCIRYIERPMTSECLMAYGDA